MLQSTAAASQGQTLGKIAFFLGQGKKVQKVAGNLCNNGQFRRNFLGLGVADTWGVIRSRPLNWDICIELSTK